MHVLSVQLSAELVAQHMPKKRFEKKAWSTVRLSTELLESAMHMCKLCSCLLYCCNGALEADLHQVKSVFVYEALQM